MKIESYEHGCQLLGHDPVAIMPDVSKVPEKYQAAYIAEHKLTIICEASRENVEIDWNTYQQYKWRPWFDMDNPGFRFDDSGCTSAYTISTGGSRICFLSKNDSDWHAKRHLDLFCAMMMGAPVKQEVL
jgi:hypothetical protein